MTSNELTIVEIKDDPEHNKFLACAIEDIPEYQDIASERFLRNY